MMTGMLNPGTPTERRTRVKRNRLNSSVFFAVMAALFLALFVVNTIHGTWLGLISTGGLAVLMGYRAWSDKGRTNQQ
jgi:uncharacterized protein with NRDE domain